tara:strand:- start:214 stop:546 length:333 start_codon:yes stop_codon:yes gene_type:complete
MKEFKNYFKYILGYESIKYTYVSGLIGISATILTLMYASQLYNKYFQIYERKDTDLDLLNIKFSLFIIFLWISSFTIFKFRYHKYFQKLALLVDITTTMISIKILFGKFT